MSQRKSLAPRRVLRDLSSRPLVSSDPPALKIYFFFFFFLPRWPLATKTVKDSTGCVYESKNRSGSKAICDAFFRE